MNERLNIAVKNWFEYGVFGTRNWFGPLINFAYGIKEVFLYDYPTEDIPSIIEYTFHELFFKTRDIRTDRIVCNELYPLLRMVQKPNQIANSFTEPPNRIRCWDTNDKSSIHVEFFFHDGMVYHIECVFELLDPKIFINIIESGVGCRINADKEMNSDNGSFMT